MSFDLNFCRDDKTVPTAQELGAYFNGQPFFKTFHQDDGGVNFGYNNEATGVYCTFSYASGQESDAELGECAASGLSFNLNFARPTFFAYETMPLVESFCRHFGLNVEDPQKETFGQASTVSLIDSWRSQNSKAVAMVSALKEMEDFDIPYLSEERATAWWTYMRDKEALEAGASEDVFVPSIFLLLTPNKQLITMMAWPNDIPQLFPPCDFVYIERTIKKLFGDKKEEGLVPYSEMISLVGPYLDDYPETTTPIKYLSEHKMDDIQPILRRLHLKPIELSAYTAVAPDSFHDVELAIG